MSTQNYDTVAQRVLVNAELKLLNHVDNIQVLGKFGDQKVQPLNKSDTVVFRRLKPYNANANETPNITAANFIVAEGVTPNANTIEYTDVTATLKQYVVLFRFSNKAQLMYQENIPQDMITLTGDTLGEVAELVCYGQMKAGSSVIYTNGTTRAGLNTSISLNKLRSAARTLESNRGKKVTSAIKPGPNFGTAAVEPAYVVFIHTDLSADVRNIAGFTPRVSYGSAITPVHEREIGAIEDFRFVTSPLFAPSLAAGLAVGADGMKSAGGVNNDVYPTIIIAQDAMGHISLKGQGKYSGISPTLIPANVKNHANPSGLFGYVGADFWYETVRLNENFMVRIESCATAL
jgi:N4-gp56 family major capsid protein